MIKCSLYHPKTAPAIHDIYYCFTDDDEEQICDALNEDEDSDLYLRVTDLIILVVIPLVIMGVLYGCIIKTLWLHSQAMGTQKIHGLGQKRRAVKTFILCMVLFFCCWFPFNMLDIVRDSLETFSDKGGSQRQEQLVWRNIQFTTIILALANSLMNPLVYAIFNPKIRYVNDILLYTKT